MTIMNNALTKSYLAGFAKSLDINNEISIFVNDTKISSLDNIWQEVWKDLDIAIDDFNKQNSFKIIDGHIKKIDSQV